MVEVTGAAVLVVAVVLADFPAAAVAVSAAAALRGGGNMSKVPEWAKELLNDTDLTEIEQAVASAEEKTSAEIVPVLVRRSSTTGHVPLAVILFLLCGYFMLSLDVGRGIIFGSDHPAWYLLDISVILLVTRLLASLECIQRWLTPRADQQLQVMERAQLEFYENRLKNTRDATGVLLFVSLLEHQVVVLADKAIADQLPAETWNDAVKMVLAGIKKGKFASGMVQAITFCGQQTESLFPIKPDDTNELKNHLVIKE